MYKHNCHKPQLNLKSPVTKRQLRLKPLSLSKPTTQVRWAFAMHFSLCWDLAHESCMLLLVWECSSLSRTRPHGIKWKTTIWQWTSWTLSWIIMSRKIWILRIFCYKSNIYLFIKQISANFQRLAQTNKHKAISISPYNFSKVGLVALTRIQQRLFDSDSRKDIVVNAVCPGLCKTDMTEQKGKFNLNDDSRSYFNLFLSFNFFCK
jgi:hypothetical protein